MFFFFFCFFFFVFWFSDCFKLISSFLYFIFITTTTNHDSLQDNRLTEIPPQVSNLSQLLWVFFQGNQITRIPRAVGSMLANRVSVLFSLTGNPSVCFRAVDPLTQNMTIVCDCAESYFGTTFCEPLASVIQLPSIVSPQTGVRIASPLLQGGLYTRVVTYSDIAAVSLTFSMTLNTGLPVTATIYQIASVFQVRCDVLSKLCCCYCVLRNVM